MKLRLISSFDGAPLVLESPYNISSSSSTTLLHIHSISDKCITTREITFSCRCDIIPQVLDDGLCFRMIPDDNVLFDRAADFVLRGEHPTHISVCTQCNYAGLLLNKAYILDELITVVLVNHVGLFLKNEET